MDWDKGYSPATVDPSEYFIRPAEVNIGMPQCSWTPGGFNQNFFQQLLELNLQNEYKYELVREGPSRGKRTSSYGPPVRPGQTAVVVNTSRHTLKTGQYIAIVPPLTKVTEYRIIPHGGSNSSTVSVPLTVPAELYERSLNSLSTMLSFETLQTGAAITVPEITAYLDSCILWQEALQQTGDCVTTAWDELKHIFQGVWCEAQSRVFSETDVVQSITSFGNAVQGNVPRAAAYSATQHMIEAMEKVLVCHNLCRRGLTTFLHEQTVWPSHSGSAAIAPGSYFSLQVT